MKKLTLSIIANLSFACLLRSCSRIDLGTTAGYTCLMTAT